MRAFHVLLAILVVSLVACSGDDDSNGVGFQCPATTVTPLTSGYFTDISEASGIRVGNFVPNPPSPIPINDHSRLGFVDLNGDHCDDIVAHNLYPNWTSAMIPFSHVVLLSNCDGTFTDFAEASGLGDVQAAFFAFGDVDNDGDQDCFAGLDTPIPGEGNKLLLNDGSGHFTLKVGAGIEGQSGNTVAGNAVFADFNKDGKLDLFIGNGHTGYLSGDTLYFGNGDGTFTGMSANLAGRTAFPSNGSVACDYDNDGDLDIFVAVYGVSNGGAQNNLWENDGTGRFTEVGVARGFASLPTGNYFLNETEHGLAAEPGPAGPGTFVGGNNFGLQCEDVDNDGDLDVYITSISHPVASDYSRKWSDPTALLINQGAEGGYAFVNEFLQRGLPFNEGDVDGAMIDFDNDGRMDLSASRTDKYEAGYTSEAQKGWFGLFAQKDNGTFADVSLTSGINDDGLMLGRMKGGQNHAWADIDHDGDLDLLVGGRDQGGGRPNFLFRNDVGSTRTWLVLRMVGDGVRVNRDAIGTRVTLRFGTTQLVREVKSSRGTYNSMDTRDLYFGLGDLGCAFTVEVRWPDGTTTTFDAKDTEVNKFVTITYGQATVSKE